jgi:hypothetical protein
LFGFFFVVRNVFEELKVAVDLASIKGFVVGAIVEGVELGEI